MLAERSILLRRELSRATRLLSADRRFIDLGVEIRVIAQHQDGIPIAPQTAKVCQVGEEIRAGGVYDCIARRWHDESEDPLVWHVSAEQLKVMLHQYEQPCMVAQSAPGVGKTTIAARWLMLRHLDALDAGVFGSSGATAPTNERKLTVLRRIKDSVPIDTPREPRAGSWGTYYSGIDTYILFKFGHLCYLRTTQQQSEDTGSPVQGFDANIAMLNDEMQDSLQAENDIQERMRGRENIPRLSVCTQKMTPGFRDWRQAKKANRDFVFVKLPYTANPIEPAENWQRKRRNMSERDWKARMLCQDLALERALYQWDRERNLRPIPQVGAKDVTREVLAGYGRNFWMLIGHDPGALQNTSILLTAHQLRGRREPVWWATDEFVTEGTTSEQHALALRDYLRERYNLQRGDSEYQVDPRGRQVLVFCDPSNDNNQQQPDQQTFKVWRNVGFAIKPAAYFKNTIRHGKVPKESRIEVVNLLLNPSAGEPRLMVACDERQQPKCPKLVECFEVMERDLDGKAETLRKNRQDKSHAGAALGYGLWPIEKVRLDPSKWRTSHG